MKRVWQWIKWTLSSYFIKNDLTFEELQCELNRVRNERIDILQNQIYGQWVPIEKRAYMFEKLYNAERITKEREIKRLEKEVNNLKSLLGQIKKETK